MVGTCLNSNFFKRYMPQWEKSIDKIIQIIAYSLDCGDKTVFSLISYENFVVYEVIDVSIKR